MYNNYFYFFLKKKKEMQRTGDYKLINSKVHAEIKLKKQILRRLDQIIALLMLQDVFQTEEELQLLNAYDMEGETHQNNEFYEFIIEELVEMRDDVLTNKTKPVEARQYLRVFCQNHLNITF